MNLLLLSLSVSVTLPAAPLRGPNDVSKEDPAAVAKLKELGAVLEFADGERHVHTVLFVDRRITDEELALVARLPYLRRLQACAVNITDKGLAHLRDATELRELHLGSAVEVTDDGLEVLKRLTRLENLGLHAPRATDRTLTYIKRLPRLKALCIWGAPFTDAGLEELKGLSGLEFLDVAHTKATDGCLGVLKKFTKLHTLDVQGTSISAEGTADLKKALPKARVIR